MKLDSSTMPEIEEQTEIINFAFLIFNSHLIKIKL